MHQIHFIGMFSAVCNKINDDLKGRRKRMAFFYMKQKDSKPIRSYTDQKWYDSK